MWRLTSFLRLQLPHRHGDDCESAIINKNNPTAHARATCHLDVVPTRYYYFCAQNSRELKQHRTPLEEGMLFGDCLKTEVGPSGHRLPLTKHWTKGGVVCLNGYLPLGDREALFINNSATETNYSCAPNNPPKYPRRLPAKVPVSFASAFNAFPKLPSPALS